jgi:hypothetical protein
MDVAISSLEQEPGGITRPYTFEMAAALYEY